MCDFRPPTQSFLSETSPLKEELWSPDDAYSVQGSLPLPQV